MYAGENHCFEAPVQRTRRSFGERHIARTDDRGQRGRHACR